MVGLRQRGDAVAADGGEIAREHVDEGFRLHLLDVGAGGKGLFAAGQQDAADVVVGLEIVDGRRDFAKHAERQRIEHFRAVQRDDADRAFALDNDVFEGAMSHPAPGFAGNVPAGGMGFKWGDPSS